MEVPEITILIFIQEYIIDVENVTSFIKALKKTITKFWPHTAVMTISAGIPVIKQIEKEISYSIIY